MDVARSFAERLRLVLRRGRAKPTCLPVRRMQTRLGHPVGMHRQSIKDLESENPIQISCTNVSPILSAKRGTYLRWT